MTMGGSLPTIPPIRVVGTLESSADAGRSPG
jgi:hypothetical protein